MTITEFVHGEKGSPMAIEMSEKSGQIALVASTNLPKECNPSREAFEKEGFIFGEDVDDLFVSVTMPEGWTRRAADHSMWSYIDDEQGRERVSVFYKAAFYDRRAFCTLFPK